MNSFEIEVMSQHYMGSLSIESVSSDHTLFAVYLQGEILGLVKPIRNQHSAGWYSYEITDNELLKQIGDWIDFYYPETKTKRHSLHHEIH